MQLLSPFKTVSDSTQTGSSPLSLKVHKASANSLMAPLMGTHRSYSISLGEESPFKCVSTTLHARKNSEIAPLKTFDNTNFSPRNLVSDARREAAQIDSD